MLRKAVDAILSLVLSSDATMELTALSSGGPAAQAATKISPSTRINLLQYLDSLGKENVAFYKGLAADAVPVDKYDELIMVLHLMCGHIQDIDRLTSTLMESCHLFDCPNQQEGNGYRSLVAVTDSCVMKLLELNIYMKEQHNYFYFRRQHYTQEIKEYADCLGMLRAMLKYAERMIEVESVSEEKDLFPRNGPELLDEWLINVETLNQICFYGVCTAYHICRSIRMALHTITTAFAAFAEKYKSMEEENPGSGPEALGYLGENLLASRKFVMDQKLKAQLLVSSTRDNDIRFCKAFWSIAESKAWEPVHWWMLPKVDLNRVFFIQPETFSLPRIDCDREVLIRPPQSHLGERPLQVRLISAQLREGQLFIGADDTVQSFKVPERLAQKSDWLIFHCHGGGFVSQSSKACDLYLKEWAKDLQIPVFSIDYTLAPEGPFPRAVEETFYAYCWALKNSHKLGWNGQKIMLVGDSAGGNLVFGAVFKAFMEGIRIPDAILSIYAPFLAQYTPSPSRLMCLMDPLIPIGILTRCFAAYAGLPEPTNVGEVQAASNGNGTRDEISPSKDSKTSWDELNLSELHGVEEMRSISTSPSDIIGVKVAEELAQEAIRDEQRRFPFSLPTAQSIYSLTSPVTSRMSNGVSRMKGAVARGYDGIRNLTDHSATSADKKRQRLMSLANPVWTRAANPLKRYDFSSVPVDDPLLSPLQANENLLRSLPPVYLIAAHLDPFLDDSVALARRLDKLDKPVKLDLVPHLPHGFLSFILVSEEARQANRLAIQRMRDIMS